MKTLFLTISIALLTLCVTVSACRAHRPAAVNTASKDSVSYREIIRDTVVRTEPDSALVRALIECDSLGQAHVRALLDRQNSNGGALHIPSFYIDDNVLHVKNFIDSLSYRFTLKDTFTDRRTTEKETVIVEVNRLTWWQKLWVGMGRVTVAGGGLFLIFKLLKRY